jgi:hypothetical protein
VAGDIPTHLARFSRWLTAYGDGWEAGDPEAMVALFVVGATFQPDPFAPLIRGRRAIAAYLAGVVRQGGGTSFSAEVLGAGETYGVAHWRVGFADHALDGVLVCALDRRGRCTSLRQWWHSSAPGA